MTPPSPRRRRILYVAAVAPSSTARFRFESLQRLDQEALPFDLQEFEPSTRVARMLQSRYPVGPIIASVNRALCKVAATFRPDMVWFDKPTVFTPETLHIIHRGGAQIVFYVQDAPFGPRNDGCWRQFRRAYRMADLHCLLRQADIARYRAWQLPWIETMFSFDPRLHIPPRSSFSDTDRERDVSYIGHPHERRPAFLLELARDHHLNVFINGNFWSRVFTREELQNFTLGDFLAGEHYRSGIWRSKINLSFVTEDNEDDIAHKAVEIAACAGFLLALRTPGHQALFDEDREAVFFSSVEECADKARFYLTRPDLREAIAARGRDRAVRSGYDNDTQLARILNKLDGRPE
jgi:spore maturation protein CgeB